MSKVRRPGPTVRTKVVEAVGDDRLRHEDRLATEEPLEMRLTWASRTGPAETRSLGVTMRTPGNDFELAVGWAVHEQVLLPADLLSVQYCTDEVLSAEQEFNVVTVAIGSAPRRLPEPRWINSACGVCGTDSIEELLRDLPVRPPAAAVPIEVLRGLPDQMRARQPGFDRTGAVHAAGLFDSGDGLVVVREDVGRHNAVDKVVGERVLTGSPVPEVLVLSGRVGFELVQKAVVAGIGTIVAVGAPTSLAVGLAEQAGISLVGFTRPERCVVYAGAARLGV